VPKRGVAGFVVAYVVTAAVLVPAGLAVGLVPKAVVVNVTNAWVIAMVAGLAYMTRPWRGLGITAAAATSGVVDP
jgi:hypothetical protein